MQIHSTVPFALATRTRTDFSGKNSLNSKQEHSTVSLESKDTVHFSHKTSKESVKDWEKKCRAIGISQEKINEIKTQAANSPIVTNTNGNSRGQKRYVEQRRALQAYYDKIIANESGVYDGAHIIE